MVQNILIVYYEFCEEKNPSKQVCRICYYLHLNFALGRSLHYIRHLCCPINMLERHLVDVTFFSTDDHWYFDASTFTLKICESFFFFLIWNDLNDDISFWNMLFWEHDIFNLNNIFSSPLITDRLTCTCIDFNIFIITR